MKRATIIVVCIAIVLGVLVVFRLADIGRYGEPAGVSLSREGADLPEPSAVEVGAALPAQTEVSASSKTTRPTSPPNKEQPGLQETTVHELEQLIVLARSQDAVTREKAIGELLTRVKPRMSRRHIERWIGPPSTIEDGEALGEAGTLYATYYCRLANWPGIQMMTVHYQRDGGRDIFIEVRGPHFPDG